MKIVGWLVVVLLVLCGANLAAGQFPEGSLLGVVAYVGAFFGGIYVWGFLANLCGVLPKDAE